MLREGKLTIDPTYRETSGWSAGKRSRLVESLILKMPIPALTAVEHGESGVYELVDGLNRIHALLQFLGDGERETERLRLTECDLIPRLNNRTIDELPGEVRRELEMAVIRLNTVPEGGIDHLRYYMFKRMNGTTGRPSAQQLRRAGLALLDTRLETFILEQTKYPPFVLTIAHIGRERARRRFDEELVLRFFAFHTARFEFSGDVDDFLNQWIESIVEEKRPFDFEREKAFFRTTFRILEAALGKEAFAPLDVEGRPRQRFAEYLYEPIVLGIQPFVESLDLDSSDQITSLAEGIRSAKKAMALQRLVTAEKREIASLLHGAMEEVASQVTRRLRG